jgi:hypothetical protein
MSEDIVKAGLSKELLAWLSSAEEAPITESVTRAIDSVCKDRSKVAELFLSAMAKKHIERVLYYFSRLPDVEERLLAPGKLAAAETKDLTKLLDVMWTQIHESLEFLKSFVDTDRLKTPTPPSEKVVDAKPVAGSAIKDMGPAARHRVRALLESLFDEIKEKEDEKKA